MGSTDEQRLGASLARARQAASLTQVGAAALLGVSQSRLAKLETGRRRLTYLDAVRVARAYGVSISSFEPSPEAD
jgi:transcriptional regulator with XRE-family HTH domain